MKPSDYILATEIKPRPMHIPTGRGGRVYIDPGMHFVIKNFAKMHEITIREATDYLLNVGMQYIVLQNALKKKRIHTAADALKKLRTGDFQRPTLEEIAKDFATPP